MDESDVVQQRFVLRTRTASLLVRQVSFGPFRDGAWGASALLKHYAATGPAALTPPADSRALGVFGLALLLASVVSQNRYENIDMAESLMVGAVPVLARAYLSVTGYWIDLVVTTGILLAFAAALAP